MPPPPASRPPDPLAVGIVVGIERYNSRIPGVTFAERDAAVVREYFIRVLGVKPGNLVYLTNDQATKGAIETAFEALLANARPLFVAPVASYLPDVVPAATGSIFWLGTGLTLSATRSAWDPSPADRRVLLFGETLQLGAMPAWVFKAGQNEATWGTAPAAKWSQTGGPAGTLGSGGLFTAGGSYATASNRAALGSIQSNAIEARSEDVTVVAGLTEAMRGSGVSALVAPAVAETASRVFARFSGPGF